MMTPKQAFKECAVFESLSDPDLDRIVALAQPSDWEAGATLFGEGSPAKDLFVLEKGKIALQMHLSTGNSQLAKRVTVDVVTKGDVVGWSAVVEPYKYNFTAVCLEPTRLLGIDGSKLRGLLRDDYRMGYEVLRRLIQVVASRLDETRHVLISERLATM